MKRPEILSLLNRFFLWQKRSRWKNAGQISRLISDIKRNKPDYKLGSFGKVSHGIIIKGSIVDEHFIHNNN